MRKSLLCSVVMLLAETCVSWAEAPSRRAIIELPKCGLCAHRGAMSTHPENTLSSFREAIRCGAHMIEMKAAFIQLKGAISPKFSDYTKQLKRNGVRINYFGTDSPERLRSLFELGVEFPLVNKIDASMKVAEELGMQRVRPIFRDETPGGTGH